MAPFWENKFPASAQSAFTTAKDHFRFDGPPSRAPILVHSLEEVLGVRLTEVG